MLCNCGAEEGSELLIPYSTQKQKHNECMIGISNHHISFLQLYPIFVFMFSASYASHVWSCERCWDLESLNRHTKPLILVTFLPSINLYNRNIWKCRNWYKQLPEKQTGVMFVPPATWLPSNVVLCIQKEFLMSNYFSAPCFPQFSGTSWTPDAEK